MSEASAAPLAGDVAAPVVSSSAPASEQTQGQAPGAATETKEEGSILAAEKPVEEKAAVDPVKPEPAGPVEYTDFKLPDGVAGDSDMFKAFSETGKTLGLKQADAEALVAAVAPELAKQMAAPLEAWQAQRTAWTKEIQNDPIYGGNKLDSHSVAIGRLFDNKDLVDPGMREALRLTGADNNPAIYRTFARLAAVLTEGSHVDGKPAVTPSRSAAQTLYPNQGA